VVLQKENLTFGESCKTAEYLNKQILDAAVARDTARK